MAGTAIISIIEPGALHGAGSVGEDSGNDISAKVAIDLFDHIAMRFHSQPVTQPYDGLALFITTEMDVGFAVAFVPLENSLEVL